MKTISSFKVKGFWLIGMLGVNLSRRCLLILRLVSPVRFNRATHLARQLKYVAGLVILLSKLSIVRQIKF